jgi:hypothetical protein
MTIDRMPFASLRLSDEHFQNPRTRSGLGGDEIAELGMHIGTHGLIVPLVVTHNGLIISGQRRYHAIDWLIRMFHGDRSDAFEALTKDLTPDEWSILTARAIELRDGIPVVFISRQGGRSTAPAIEAVALADNILRSDLSSFEIAKHLVKLSEEGSSGRELARLTGKSTSYISRKLSTYRGAGEPLRRAWELGELTESVVEEIAQLSFTEQFKAMAAPIARGRRGPANRPNIDTVKDAHLMIEARTGPDASRAREYLRGARDALRWVTGEQTSAEFAELVKDPE